MKTGEILAERYLVGRYLGAGGMQDVWYAEDTYFLRGVVIKTPKSNSARKRFKRSAVLSASINHPNVAKTLDFFEVDGDEFIVEEYLAGGDLDAALIRRVSQVDPPLTARIFHNLSKGLAAAHAAQVVHRDIKPTNVLFEQNDERFEAKFTDFGIAKMAEEVLDDDIVNRLSSQLSSSTFLGAMPYMAPEMLSDTRRSTTASDVWSLGALIYEVLTGRTPYGTGYDAIPKILAGAKPADPTGRFGAQFKPLASEIWEMIQLCMSAQAERPSALALVQMSEKLCYPINARASGVVRSRSYNYGFIQPDGGGDDVFFHIEAVCGPPPKVGDRLLYGSFPGHPRSRAFPLVFLR